MPKPSPAILALVERHPWELALPRLLAYARSQVRNLVWGGVRGGHLPGGHQAEDVVNIAVQKLLTGSRRWDPEQQPDVEDFLRGVIDSEVSHLAEGWENRRVRTEATLSPDAEHAFSLDGVAGGDLGGEALLTLEEDAERSRSFAVRFVASLADEGDLQNVAACIVEGVVKPAEVAARLGITVEQVYNMRKQLQRRLEAFYALQRRDEPEGGAGWSKRR